MTLCGWRPSVRLPSAYLLHLILDFPQFSSELKLKLHKHVNLKEIHQIRSFWLWFWPLHFIFTPIDGWFHEMFSQPHIQEFSQGLKVILPHGNRNKEASFEDSWHRTEIGDWNAQILFVSWVCGDGCQRKPCSFITFTCLHVLVCLNHLCFHCRWTYSPGHY